MSRTWKFLLERHDRNGFLDAVRSPFPLQGKLILMAKKNSSLNTYNRIKSFSKLKGTYFEGAYKKLDVYGLYEDSSIPPFLVSARATFQIKFRA